MSTEAARIVEIIRCETGCGLVEAGHALRLAEGDPWLAVGYVEHKGIRKLIRIPADTARGYALVEGYDPSGAEVFAAEYKRKRPDLITCNDG